MAIFQYPRRVARNIVEGEYTERNVKFLTYLTEPQGKIKKYGKEREILNSPDRTAR